jgi:glycosyltransferase involved in cell wall biosynthesis
MNSPAVSVILPAYNCERYIGRAIQSVLDQTFSDFELIIINDGSTDKTEFAVLSFSDHRIVYQKNETNQGLVYSLNRAIDLAGGKYIARMDADDICRPERLAKQVAFLDNHNEITLVATTIDFINNEEKLTGQWELDRKTISPEQIRSKMPSENCIAHPTVMLRSSVLKEFKYKTSQKNIEDYDLWLRLLNRGHQLAKVDEPLLLYRVHGDSVTSLYLKKRNPFFKHLSMKWRFLISEFFAGRVTGFLLIVNLSCAADLVKGIAKAIKNLFSGSV